MGFKQFLKEGLDEKRAEDILKAIPEIQKNCKPYLNMMKKRFTPFFRGLRDTSPVVMHNRRKGRQPRDTWIPFDQYINAFLKENKVTPRSEGIFARDTPNVGPYGETYYLLPVGKFDFYSLTGMTWKRKTEGPIFDITSQLQLQKSYYTAIDMDLKADLADVFSGNISRKKMREQLDQLRSLYDVETTGNTLDRFEKTLDIIDDMKVTKNKFVDGTPEYVLNCDKYYAVHKFIYDTLEEKDPDKFNLFNL